MTHTIGVCSWSLEPSGPRDLARRAAACGVAGVQLALEPLRSGAWSTTATVAELAERGLRLISGMASLRGEDYSTLASIRRTGGVRPDEHWPANLAAVRECAALAERLGLDLVSFHAGFLPEERADPLRARMLERLAEVVDVFAAHGVRTAFETGQERAETLADVLRELDRPTAGVNFDPANLLLYDQGDPIAALATLAPHVLQIHVKDALRTREPGTWGREVPAGTGEVDWPAFFEVLRARAIAVDLVIEREAGLRRAADVRAARALVERRGAPA